MRLQGEAFPSGDVDLGLNPNDYTSKLGRFRLIPSPVIAACHHRYHIPSTAKSNTRTWGLNRGSNLKLQIQKGILYKSHICPQQ
jgi:hypothetical protein